MLSREKFGLYLKSIREAKDLSLRTVEKMTNGEIKYSQLSMIESGKRNYTPELLLNLSKLYNIDCVDLYIKAGYLEEKDINKFNNTKDLIEKITNEYEKQIQKIKEDILLASYNGFNLDGLDENDIKEIKNYINYKREQKNK